MDTLRVLVVGNPRHLETITSALTAAGHNVVPVPDVADAAEALLIQRFDAVLMGQMPPADVLSFTGKVKELDRRGGNANRTPVLSLVPTPEAIPPVNGTGVDGYLPESSDPDTLTLAIARLASAVGMESVGATSLAETTLPVLDVEQLKEQVAYDDELLVELIDLFLSERVRQVQEMDETFLAGDFDQLSRIAHTIKGSLGSLHALAAKANAQALELSAKEHNAPSSQVHLEALKSDLDVLEGQLLNVRKSVTSS